MQFISQNSVLNSAVSLLNIAASKQKYLRRIQETALKNQANSIESKYQFYITEKFKDQQQIRAACSMFRSLQRIQLKTQSQFFQILKHKPSLKNVKNINLQQKQIKSSEKLRRILQGIKQRDNKKGLQVCIKFLIKKNLNLIIQKLKQNELSKKKIDGFQILKRVCESSQKRYFIQIVLKNEKKQSREDNFVIKDNTFLNQFSSILHDNIFSSVQGEQLSSQKSPYSNFQIPQSQREQYRQVIRQKQNQINDLKRQLSQNGNQTEKLKDSIKNYQKKMNQLIWNSKDGIIEEYQEDSKKNSTSPHSSLSSSRNQEVSSSEDLVDKCCGAPSTLKQTNKIRCSALEDQAMVFGQQPKKIKGNHGRYFSQDIQDFQQSITNREDTKVQQQMLSKFMRQVFELRQKMDVAREMCQQLKNKIDEGESASSLFATLEGKHKAKTFQQKRIVSQILKLLMPEEMITGEIGEAYGFEAI